MKMVSPSEDLPFIAGLGSSSSVGAKLRQVHLTSNFIAVRFSRAEFLEENS